MISGRCQPICNPLLLASLLVFGLHHLGVVLEDVRQALAGQHLAPQVVGLDAARVGRVAGAVVPAPVEGQEPGRLPIEVRAEQRLALVDGEVGPRSGRNSNSFSRGLRSCSTASAAVCLVRLFFKFEGGDRQAVDEQADVERPLRLVAAVAKLPHDGEAVLLEVFLRLRVPGTDGVP